MLWITGSDSKDSLAMRFMNGAQKRSMTAVRVAFDDDRFKHTMISFFRSCMWPERGFWHNAQKSIRHRRATCRASSEFKRFWTVGGLLAVCCWHSEHCFLNLFLLHRYWIWKDIIYMTAGIEKNAKEPTLLFLAMTSQAQTLSVMYSSGWIILKVRTWKGTVCLSATSATWYTIDKWHKSKGKRLRTNTAGHSWRRRRRVVKMWQRRSWLLLESELAAV